MMDIIESRIKRGFRRFGIDIRYVEDDVYDQNMYVHCLRGAISVQSPFNIIQVGANDGKYNDPIHEFVKEYKGITNIILVEPVRTVIPYLEANYSYHPSAEIINKAISQKESSSIQLYTVGQDHWDDINAGYGEDWPDYRIPTGATTTDKNQLLQWISKNIQSDTNPENIIEEFEVEIVQPDALIEESENVDNVHLLQVDTEGMDDEVVYSFFESDIYPNIINIESKHLNQENNKNYNKKLNDLGYDIYNYKSNEKLAIK